MSNQMKMLILHHDDLDGAASAAVVQFAECTLRGMNRADIVARPIRYGEDVQAVLDALGDDWGIVYVLDWTPQTGGGIQALHARLGERLVWIDHHAAAIQGYRPGDQPGTPPHERLNGIRLSESDGRPIAACELTWVNRLARWLGIVPLPPRWLTLIGDWDTWRHAKIPDSPALDIKRYFDQFGIDEMREQLVTLLFKTVQLDERGKLEIDVPAVDRNIAQMVDVGRLFGRYERAQDAELMRARAFEGTFDGVPAIIANGGQRGSGRFASVYDRARHRVMVWCGYENTGVWSVSLYSEDPTLDCGVLCQRIGSEGPVGTGGGHRGAAGFQTTWDHLRTLIVRADGKLVF